VLLESSPDYLLPFPQYSPSKAVLGSKGETHPWRDPSCRVLFGFQVNVVEVGVDEGLPKCGIFYSFVSLVAYMGRNSDLPMGAEEKSEGFPSFVIAPGYF